MGPNVGNQTFEQVSHYLKRPAPHWKISKLGNCPMEKGPLLEERPGSGNIKKTKKQGEVCPWERRAVQRQHGQRMGSTEPDLLKDSEMFFLTCELRKVFL